MKWFSVTLLKEHIHAEVKYAEGAVIRVGEHIHDWLVQEGVISPTKPDPEETAVAVSAPPAKSPTVAASKSVPAAAADQESK